MRKIESSKIKERVQKVLRKAEVIKRKKIIKKGSERRMEKFEKKEKKEESFEGLFERKKKLGVKERVEKWVGEIEIKRK